MQLTGALHGASGWCHKSSSHRPSSCDQVHEHESMMFDGAIQSWGIALRLHVEGRRANANVFIERIVVHPAILQPSFDDSGTCKAEVDGLKANQGRWGGGEALNPFES
jgi:hypothetical protein